MPGAQRPARSARRSRARRGPKSNRRRGRPAIKLPRPGEIVSLGARAARRNLRPIIAAALAAALAGGGVLLHRWLTGSPRFAIDRVEVGPLEYLPRRSLDERLGVASRPNVFRYDTAAAERRLEASPWVRRARVRRDLPDGLEVRIEERRPAAAAIAEGIYLVDEGGVPFKRATLSEVVGLGLLTITGIPRALFERAPAAARRQLERALAIAAAWGRGDGRPALGEIHLDPFRGATLITRDRAIAIRTGDGEASEVAGRLELFDRVWAGLDAQERSAAQLIVLDDSATPRRAAVAFATDSETSTWRN